jgi:hypothetical protein
MWGAQVEVGSEPSPYIRTTTGTVTANGDEIYGTLSGEVPQDQFSWYTAAIKQGSFVNSSTVLYIDAGVATDRSYHEFDGAGHSNWVVTSDNANTVAFTPTQVKSLNTLVRAAGSFDANNSSAIIRQDGAQPTGAPDDTVVVAINLPLTRISVGKHRTAALHLNGLVQEVRVYDTALSESEVLDMSNGNFPAEGHSGIGLGFGKMGAQGAQ